MTTLKIIQQVVLLLPDTCYLQQVEDYTTGCTTSTRYLLPSASWRLYKKLYYFYQILATFSKLKIMNMKINLQPINHFFFKFTSIYLNSCIFFLILLLDDLGAHCCELTLSCNGYTFNFHVNSFIIYVCVCVCV